MVCPKRNISESIKKNLLNRSVQHIIRFENRLLLRRYIASSEISRQLRRHGRPCPECPLEPWCKPLRLCQLSRNDVLPWKFSGAETKRSLGEPRQDCRVAGEWLAPSNRLGGMGWRVVVVVSNLPRWTLRLSLLSTST